MLNDDQTVVLNYALEFLDDHSFLNSNHKLKYII